MTDVNASDFQSQVLDASTAGPVVVDFWAPWCGPCRTLGPVLERLETEGAGAWKLVKINTDDNQGLSREFGIQGIPAVKAFVNGKVVAEFTGAQPEGEVRRWLRGIVPDPATLKAAAATQAQASGDAQTAAALFEEALALDPLNADALLFIAGQAEPAEARAILGRLRGADRHRLSPQVAQFELGLGVPALDVVQAANDGTTSARFTLARALARAGDHAEALEILMGLVKADRSFEAEGFGSDAVRKVMLLVFETLGPRHVLSDEYRRRLAMELYK